MKNCLIWLLPPLMMASPCIDAFEIERETAKSGRVDILIRELPKPVKRRAPRRR